MTQYPELFAALATPFAKDEVKSRAQAGRRFNYITARTAMNRLDSVLGPENWWDRYTPQEHSVLCELTIRLPDGSILTKCDAGGYAGMTDQGDDDKSGYSDGFKRAAAKFGVARYLYGDGVPEYGAGGNGDPGAPPPGKGDAYEGPAPPARREQPRQAPERIKPEGKTREAQNWSRYIGARIHELHRAWRAEMVHAEIDPEYREQHAELTCEPRVVNHLCTRLIDLGRLAKADIAKDDKPEVRDDAKSREAVVWFFESNRDAIIKGINKYFRLKKDNARAALGMPILSDEEDSREMSQALSGEAS